MGYSTDFEGSFKLNRRLSLEDYVFLTKFAGSRRMKRAGLPAEFGVDGEFYVDGADDGNMGQDDTLGVKDYNKPPSTQPGLWCQWIPTDDGMTIQWDGGEKFGEYVEWIKYLINRILSPRGYILNGEVFWQGEDSDDKGCIVINNNVVRTKKAKIVWDD